MPVCHGTLITVGFPPLTGLEPGTARSPGQHLTFGATSAPVCNDHKTDAQLNMVLYATIWL